MKIALIRKDFVLSRGGGERYAVNLCSGLIGLGHEVHLFAHRWEETLNPAPTIHPVRAYTAFSALKNLSFAYECRRLLARESFDIVHSLAQTFPQDVYRMGDGVHRHWLSIQTPRPWLRNLKTLTPRQQAILYLERQTFRPSNYGMIISNSNLCKSQARRYFNVPERKITVIYNGVDQTAFHPGFREQNRNQVRDQYQIPADAFVILFISRNFARKGLSTLIAALPGLQKDRPPIRVLVVGRGNPAPYRHLGARIGWGGQLLFVGEHDNISPFYGASDLLALPTLYDPFSNVCLEALASGIPVVTTRGNGAAEVIRPGETGWVINAPPDRQELAVAISRFFPASRGDFAPETVAQSVRHLTIAENTRQTLAVYEQVREQKQDRGTRKKDRG